MQCDASADVNICAEDATYDVVDDAGHRDAPMTMTARIESTPPVVNGLTAVDCTS